MIEDPEPDPDPDPDPDPLARAKQLAAWSRGGSLASEDTRGPSVESLPGDFPETGLMVPTAPDSPHGMGRPTSRESRFTEHADYMENTEVTDNTGKSDKDKNSDSKN